MHVKGKKFFTIIAIVVVIITAIVMIGRFFILQKIKSKLEDQLHALRDSGYIIRYDSISIDTKKNFVAVYRLSVERDLDSALCSTTDFFSAKYIQATGLNLLPLLLKKRLSFESIEIDSPRIVLYENFFRSRQTEKKDRREFSIAVEHIKMPDINFSYFDSTSCNPNTTYTSNVAIEDLVLSFYKDRQPYYNLTSFVADSISIHLPKELYTININETRLNLELGIFDLDTLRIIPHKNKLAFGREKNKEIDRFEGTIPYINLYGISFYHEDSIAITAQKMTTQVFLKAFRDKRLPFKNKYKPLPIEALYNLPIGLKIDSVILNRSYVEYEEFADDADSAGHVFFDDIYATIKNINNTEPDRKGNITMIAASSFMGQGELKVNTTLPLNPAKRCKVKGTLQNMDFAQLNRMIEPQIKIRAEAGRLNKLDFEFTYDDDQSNGKLEMEYHGLKLVTFREEEQVEKINRRKNKRKKNGEESNETVMKAPLKTLVLNVIIRKNMDDNISEDKRTGEIGFVRDKRRSIFNYWAKSMFSGIKSAYNLDKLEDSRIKKLLEKKDKD